MKHVKALLVLFAGFLILLLGTPGLDYQKWGRYDDPKEQAEVLDDYGPVWGRAVIGTATFNKEVRRPLYKRFEAVQRPFRIRQSWHLYRDGPSRVRRLEVRVDGELIHRSADPDHDWNNPVLRNRRIRPMVENTARKTGSSNWKGLTRWIVREAREDFPDAREVRISGTTARFPGTEPRVHHYYLAEAPDWKVEEHTPEEDSRKAPAGTRPDLDALRERLKARRPDLQAVPAPDGPPSAKGGRADEDADEDGADEDADDGGRDG